MFNERICAPNTVSVRRRLSALRHVAYVVSANSLAIAIGYTTFFFSWWFQGLIFTGLWVIGHEVSFLLDVLCRVNLFLKCGHGAFSDYEMINDTIGFVSSLFGARVLFANSTNYIC